MTAPIGPPQPDRVVLGIILVAIGATAIVCAILGAVLA